MEYKKSNVSKKLLTLENNGRAITNDYFIVNWNCSIQQLKHVLKVPNTLK